MAKSGVRHIDVGMQLTKEEWESEESHELVHGTSFPSSPSERQLFYRTDEHKWYIYNGTTWVWLGGGGGGMEQHGNEYHTPDFATEVALADHAALTAPHSATPAATPDRLILRDASGRAKVAAPSAAEDIAQKAQVDTVQANLTTHIDATSVHQATADATASRIVLRDAAGRAKFAAPVASGDALIRGTAITDTEHGNRGSGLHTDSHARQHALDSTTDHTGSITDTQHGTRGSGLHTDSHGRSHDHSQSGDGSPIAVSGVPDLPASKITSGQFPVNRLPDITGLHYGLIKGATYDRRYTCMTRAVALGTAGVASAANALRVLPFIPPMSISVDRICCNCTTGASGAGIKLCIYADNGSLYPGNLLLDTGAIDCTSSGFKDFTVSPTVSLVRGTLYWIGYVASTTSTLAFSKIPAGSAASIMGVSAANPPTVGMGWTVSHTYTNALPNPYPAGGTVLVNEAEVLVAIRAA